MSWMLGHWSHVTADAIKEFNTQSPRTTAVVGAAILDDCLAQVIGMRFPVAGRTKDELFKPAGPLGNLDTKVKVAYAMGIVSKPAFQDLTRLVQIRNKFAHRLDVSDFEHPEVKPHCFALTLIERHLFPRGASLEEPDSELSVRMTVEDLEDRLKIARDRYFLSVMLMHSLTIDVPHPENEKPRLRRPRL
jgi:DNA-binding MltR family transcriptional regulator